MFLLKVLAFLICSIVLIIAAFGVWFMIQTRSRRKREPGFEYVYVEDDGNARELRTEEEVYLSTEFEGGDSNRPYIKLRYEELTPDGRLGGYLRRRQLPKGVNIRPKTEAEGTS